ncbi:MAG TPA: metalloregulator ArsR/SmtB family transcription factor [Tepidisphaeraceae bacterium]|nr:metalloregulator ArsR/SmtB family transcription factor [Tepidisphaeraceae bacterium]
MKDRLNSAECSTYLRALAEPERLRIVQCLAGGPMPVGDICRQMESAMPNVSHHLKQLRIAGLVLSRKKGRFVIYELTPAVHHRGPQSALNVLEFGCCRIELGRK